jgi:hypothetical protein
MIALSILDSDGVFLLLMLAVEDIPEKSPVMLLAPARWLKVDCVNTFFGGLVEKG